MTNRELMLAAIAGRPSDRLPWAPRLDLWYKANRLAGTGDHLILGVSDTAPPGADFGRLTEIARRAEQFGPVRPPTATGAR